MSGVKSEMAHERAARLAVEIGLRASKSMSTGEAKSLMESVASLGGRDGSQPIEDTCRAPVKLDALQRGDVFLAKVTGGKLRPWVVLGICGGNVSAVTMSSAESAPNVLKSECRFWPDSWIGTTVSLFDMEYACQEVTRPYTNMAHLRQVEVNFAKSLIADRPDPVSTISEILNKRFPRATAKATA